MNHRKTPKARSDAHAFPRAIAAILWIAGCLTARAESISTVAGDGRREFAGDAGAVLLKAGDAALNFPFAVAVDGMGNLYIADTFNHRIRRVDPAGRITTVVGDGFKDAVGNGRLGGDSGSALAASLNFPTGVAVSEDGATLVIGDFGNQRVRRVNGEGIIATVASGDVWGVALPPTSQPETTPPYVVFSSAQRHQVFRVSLTSAGAPAPVAGSGTAGFGGDSKEAVEAQLNTPRGVAVDRSGNIYIADARNNRVRRVDAANSVSTADDAVKNRIDSIDLLAGNELSLPSGVAAVSREDGTVALYIANAGVSNALRTVVAGEPESATLATRSTEVIVGRTHAREGYFGDKGPATAAALNFPLGIAASASESSVFLADTDNDRIREISAGAASVAGASEQNPWANADGIAAAQPLTVAQAAALTAANQPPAMFGATRPLRRLDVSTFTVNLKFDSTASAKIAIKGSLFLDGPPGSKPVVLDVAGQANAFVLDDRGRGGDGKRVKFELGAVRVDAAVPFKASIVLDDASRLSRSGLTASPASRSARNLQIFLLIGNSPAQFMALGSYTTSKGRKGAFVLKRPKNTTRGPR